MTVLKGNINNEVVGRVQRPVAGTDLSLAAQGQQVAPGDHFTNLLKSS